MGLSADGNRAGPRRSLADPWDRVASGVAPWPLSRTSSRPRPQGCARVGHPPRQECRAGCGGGVCGSTRAAPVGRSPRRAPTAATGPRPRQRRHHPGAGPVGARGRGGGPAGPGDACGAHEVPGRRPAGARGAGPGPGRRDQHRGAPDGAAQASRRAGPDPREDRGPRHLAARPPRRGRSRLRRGQVAHGEAALGRGHRGAPRGRDAGGARPPPPLPPSVGWCRNR